MIAYRAGHAADADALAAMAQQSYIETFGTLYARADLDAFLGDVLAPERFAAQLADPAYRFRLATIEGQPIGYAKLGPQYFEDFPADAACLHQLYVLAAHHGDGPGRVLMDWALDAAQAEGKAEMYLSVFVDNHRARRFYARYGFVEVGKYVYMVGTQADDDRILRLAL
ncbi:GNAT family N-acetyltransferase [Sphingomonas baiyangensis]|uniref:GNAT family N-acetyltransferase n=1 Tax=Sphingomonas baiyangensis TaxID=2572576 RepID=A0A4V5PU75_9SPHN|nr:GNAT family N-acetyltransferase [Sphingomonas baiyangensis]TKD52938.1 GNAT family N-acetyltransferase [Sphingomonas baiyangensis]